MAIKIERFSQDKLERQMWFFSVDIDYNNNFKIILSNYFEQERKTTRHKFINKWKKIYEGNRRNSTTMKREDVPLPDDVVDEVKNQLKSKIDNVEIS